MVEDWFAYSFAVPKMYFLIYSKAERFILGKCLLIFILDPYLKSIGKNQNVLEMEPER